MKKIIFIYVLCFSTLTFAELGSTIFSFDGHDFIRTDTTLIDENGNPAINTKMDRNYPGYKSLLNGRLMLFGKLVDSKVAPLTNNKGKLIGAIAVFKDVE
jgi:methyl-accepting chemotaxis protein